MLRAAIWTLRQPRYAAFAALMAVLGAGCIGMGTFELHRFQEKVDNNRQLRANARAAETPLTTGLVPLAGAAPAPGTLDVRYRTVSVTGTYEPANQQYLGNQSQGGDQGFYVVTPLRTSSGDLLVVRGFVAAVGTESRPGRAAPPPAGTVHVVGRLQTAQTGDDDARQLGHREISTINPAQQASRIDAPTYAAFVTVGKGQPGTAGMRTLPAINLSNPTGGAGELQLFSYILQWYVFALLAFVAPFLVSRAEIRDARRDYLGIDASRIQFDELPEYAPPGDASGADVAVRGPDGELAVRGTGELARLGISAERRRRAAKLADRYGRSLGMNALDPDDIVPRTGPAIPRAWRPPGLAEPRAPRRSAVAPHRAIDDVHGDYNDYLWQLALADGEQPGVPAEDGERPDDGSDAAAGEAIDEGHRPADDDPRRDG